MPFSKCEMCDSEKSKLIKEQIPSGSLSRSGIKTPLSKISLAGHLFAVEI